jgi:hypothetical protein
MHGRMKQSASKGAAIGAFLRIRAGRAQQSEQ